MGNIFRKEADKIKAGQVIAIIVGAYVLYMVAGFIVWKCKNIGNKAEAKRLRDERDAKHFQFGDIAADKKIIIANADVT